MVADEEVEEEVVADEGVEEEQMKNDGFLMKKVVMLMVMVGIKYSMVQSIV